MQVFDAAATRRALGWPAMLTALRDAVLDLADGRIVCPERLVVPMTVGSAGTAGLDSGSDLQPADGGLLLSMPAVAADIATHKLITVTPQNKRLGLPTIQGHVSVLDAHTGKTLLMLDGPTVTGRRTAGISLLAMATLCRRPPAHVLVIGTGAQALHHVEGLAALYPDAHIAVRGSSAASTRDFCAGHAALHPQLRPDVGDGDSDGDSADVVITCTSSRLPVYKQPARPERLLIAVGAFRPDAAEIDAATVRGSRVWVDDPAGARHEAGDLLLAGVDWHQVSPLAHALRHGVQADGQARLFKSVGCAAWDLAAARVVVQGLQTTALAKTG